MMHRGLARLAVAATAALVAGAIGAAPAAATDPSTPPPTAPDNAAQLDLSGPLLAKDFATKGCDGITGGAKAGTDGWVFDQPVKGVTEYAYVFGFVDTKRKPVVLLVTEGGVFGFDNPAAGALALESKAAGELTSAEEGGDIDLPPAPEGVHGGLIPNGGWLQTPAGWTLTIGFLVHDNETAGKAKFHLLRVCMPVTSTPTGTASPSQAGGTGGGSGGSLPVTGANAGMLAGAGLLLVAVGAMLFVVRRRRDATKFVA